MMSPIFRGRTCSAKGSDREMARIRRRFSISLALSRRPTGSAFRCFFSWEKKYTPMITVTISCTAVKIQPKENPPFYLLLMMAKGRSIHSRRKWKLKSEK